MLKNPKNKKTLKWLLIAGGSLLLIGLVVYFYFATLSHDDTASLKADYTVESIPFIKEIEKYYKASNKKYSLTTSVSFLRVIYLIITIGIVKYADQNSRSLMI